MTESIGEMIIPGTYIEVRAEGLIGVGGISTGNIGVVGTANRGPVGEAVILGSYAEALSTFGNYDPWPDAAATPRLTLTRALEQVFRGGGSSVYAVRVAALPNDVPAMRSMVWRVRAGNNVTIFSLTATSPGTWANSIVAELTPPAEAGADAVLTLTLGATRETFRGATAGVLAQEINDASNFVTADTPGTPTSVPASVVPVDEAERGGPDGVAVTATHIGAGLAVLATQPVNIVNVAGLGADVVFGTVLGHLEATETEGNERIAIMGARADDARRRSPRTTENVSATDGRFWSLPASSTSDAARRTAQVELPAAYAAALVAGRLSSIAPHVSLTNKDVAADDLTRRVHARGAEAAACTIACWCCRRTSASGCCKGITTDTGAFRQISRPPHRRLRQGGRAHRLQPLHRPAQQLRACARRSRPRSTASSRGWCSTRC